MKIKLFSFLGAYIHSKSESLSRFHGKNDCLLTVLQDITCICGAWVVEIRLVNQDSMLGPQDQDATGPARTFQFEVRCNICIHASGDVVVIYPIYLNPWVVRRDTGFAGAANALRLSARAIGFQNVLRLSVRAIGFQGIGAHLHKSVRQLNKRKLNDTCKYLLFQFFL